MLSRNQEGSFAQGHTRQNQHTIPLFLFIPPFVEAKHANQLSPNSHPALNRKQQLLSTFPADEEPAWHVSVAMTGLI